MVIIFWTTKTFLNVGDEFLRLFIQRSYRRFRKVYPGRYIRWDGRGEVVPRVQAVVGPRKPAAKRSTKRMYRGVITAQAIQDVFIRATSDAAANTAIKV